MKIAKPQWNLLTYVLPPIFSSLVLIFFFPIPLFSFLVFISILALLLSSFVGFKTLKHIKYEDKKHHVARWLFSLLRLIFLLGISALFFIFLTAASGLSPEKLNFGNIIKIWHVTFFTGICFLFAQLIVMFIQTNSSLAKHCCQLEKTQITNQIFLRFSGLVVLVASLSVVILTIANALVRLVGIQVPTGLQLPTMIGSTLIYLPFITKRWQKKRFLLSHRSRSFRLFKLMIGLIIAIVLISIITFPFSGVPIPIQFLVNGLATSQWELFILAWWIGITPLVANRIITLSEDRSLSQILIALTIFSICVYALCTVFLLHGGQEYFLAVIEEGIPALLLTALPIGILVLTLSPFQRAMSIQSTRSIQKKRDRREQYLTHSLIQITVIACVLYWVSGLTLLFVLLLMVSIPYLMLFLLEAVGATAEKKV